MSGGNRATLRTAPPWKPGQSGNELGRHRNYQRVLHTARKNSPEAMEKAVQCMRDETAPWPQRLHAIAMILERAWGKPREQHDFTGLGSGNQIVIVTGVPDAELRADAEPPQEQLTFTIDLEAQDTGD